MVAAGLVVDGLTRRFGGIVAVDRCSFQVAPGEIVGLIGPNGSGKSTLFNLITNILRPDAGSVSFRGRALRRLRLHQIARLGIGRTFQEIKIFRDLSVWENLRLAALGRRMTGWEDDAGRMLDRMALAHLRDDPAEQLSVGQQRLLELAMQLLVRPDLLMLDEPLAGVHPRIRERIAELIRAERAAGKAVLLIEHDLRFVMSLCDRIVAMDHGEKIAEGPPEAVRADPHVVAALMGSRQREAAHG